MATFEFRFSSRFSTVREALPNRGTGRDDLLTRPLTSSEQNFADFWFDRPERNAALDALLLGLIPGFPPPDNSAFEGGQQYYGRGGNDYVADLLGSNGVTTREGNDRILLGSGNDRVYDTGGDNDIDILGGNNVLTLGEGNDVVVTGAGNDTMFIRGGDNIIVDQGGTNNITTRNGADQIQTGDGNDNINAFGGRNLVIAGEGRNIVRGGNDFDDVRVGRGNDFVEVRGGSNAPGQTGTYDIDSVLASRGIDASQYEIGVTTFVANNLVLDDGGDDRIRATSGASRKGDDLVFSDLDAAVKTDGSADAAAAGDDRIELGAGEDLVIDFGGDNVVRVGPDNDFVYTSLEFAGDDEIDGGAGNDTLVSGGGDDDIQGGDGNDQIDAGAGDDVIDGGTGDDGILPGAGSDIIRGNAGQDQILLTSDNVRDVLVYEGPDRTSSFPTTDIVQGFEVAFDQFDVRALGVVPDDLWFLDLKANGNAVADALLGWDQNRNGAPDFFMALVLDVPGAVFDNNDSLFVFDDALLV